MTKIMKIALGGILTVLLVAAIGGLVFMPLAFGFGGICFQALCGLGVLVFFAGCWITIVIMYE